ncbi:uncharacterized protein LOC144661781 [Oculina patagonica]
MALNYAKVQLFNCICRIGDDAEDALASDQTKLEVKNWLETHADRLALFKDQDGKPIGNRIDLRREICLQYLDTGLSHPPKVYYCARWHICKRFIEGDCDGKCGRSHDFHDKDNRTNTTEAGLENFPSQLIRNIVALSLPRVCLLYSKSECKSRACPYLHVCPSVIRKTHCECCMSHNLLDQHNEKVLERYNLHLWLKSKRTIDFVLCNILCPVEPKVCKSSKDSYQSYRKETMLTSKLPVASHLMSKEFKATPKLLNRAEPGKWAARMNQTDKQKTRDLEGQGPSLKLPSESKTDFERSAQTKVLYRSRGNLTVQDSKSRPVLQTLKPVALTRQEPGPTRDRLKQPRNIEGQAPKRSGKIMTGSKDVQVQNRSLSDSSTDANVGGPCFRHDRKPIHWSSTASGTSYTRVKVAPGSSEFKEVETLFRKTMKDDKIIDSVERVENPFLWETYCRKKDHMVALAKQNDPQSMASEIIQNSEKRLFHGTSAEVVEAISKKNFDWRVCGKNGTKYGEGSYFATNASYSHSYSKSDFDGSRFMFLARVLVGSYTKGRPAYRRPPLKDPSDPASDLFNSCVDNECNPKIFVISDSDQLYPEYILKYFTLEQIEITANS